MKKAKGKGFIEVKGYDWGLYPKTEKLINKEIKIFLKNNKFARNLAKQMNKKTSTEIIDWVDHLVVPNTRLRIKNLHNAGFIHQQKIKSEKNTRVYKNTKTILPPILLSLNNKTELALKPENLDKCVNKLNDQCKTLGLPFSPYRKAIINSQNNFNLTAVERRGSNNFKVEENTKDISQYRIAIKIFEKRKRSFSSDKVGLTSTNKLIKKSLKNLSPSRTADAFFRTERNYWESKNKAGKIQRKRQDSLGLGWGNHDHHTYRASRKHFTDLIEIFELMGYECRERFFAGEKAGWGAQVLEHSQCDIVIFADLDITKKEKDTDFAHRGVSKSKNFGTVGLWVALHGESILQSGMHHLEARFSFDKLIKDLPNHGVSVMKPFSNFKFLKQAFTHGENWKVDKKRAKKLLNNNQITKENYSIFLKKGAIGSHLENLQRRQGYKGFNQNSVSAIIKATNPLMRLRRENHRAA